MSSTTSIRSAPKASSDDSSAPPSAVYAFATTALLLIPTIASTSFSALQLTSLLTNAPVLLTRFAPIVGAAISSVAFGISFASDCCTAWALYKEKKQTETELTTSEEADKAALEAKIQFLNKRLHWMVAALTIDLLFCLLFSGLAIAEGLLGAFPLAALISGGISFLALFARLYCLRQAKEDKANAPAETQYQSKTIPTTDRLEEGLGFNESNLREINAQPPVEKPIALEESFSQNPPTLSSVLESIPTTEQPEERFDCIESSLSPPALPGSSTQTSSNALTQITETMPTAQKELLQWSDQPSAGTYTEFSNRGAALGMLYKKDNSLCSCTLNELAALASHNRGAANPLLSHISHLKIIGPDPLSEEIKRQISDALQGCATPITLFYSEQKQSETTPQQELLIPEPPTTPTSPQSLLQWSDQPAAEEHTEFSSKPVVLGMLYRGAGHLCSCSLDELADLASHNRGATNPLLSHISHLKIIGPDPLSEEIKRQITTTLQRCKTSLTLSYEQKSHPQEPSHLLPTTASTLRSEPASTATSEWRSPHSGKDGNSLRVQNGTLVGIRPNQGSTCLLRDLVHLTSNSEGINELTIDCSTDCTETPATPQPTSSKQRLSHMPPKFFPSLQTVFGTSQPQPDNPPLFSNRANTPAAATQRSSPFNETTITILHNFLTNFKKPVRFQNLNLPSSLPIAIDEIPPIEQKTFLQEFIRFLPDSKPIEIDLSASTACSRDILEIVDQLKTNNSPISFLLPPSLAKPSGEILDLITQYGRSTAVAEALDRLYNGPPLYKPLFYAVIAKKFEKDGNHVKAEEFLRRAHRCPAIQKHLESKEIVEFIQAAAASKEIPEKLLKDAREQLQWTPSLPNNTSVTIDPISWNLAFPSWQTRFSDQPEASIKVHDSLSLQRNLSASISRPLQDATTITIMKKIATWLYKDSTDLSIGDLDELEGYLILAAARAGSAFPDRKLETSIVRGFQTILTTIVCEKNENEITPIIEQQVTRLFDLYYYLTTSTNLNLTEQELNTLKNNFDDHENLFIRTTPGSLPDSWTQEQWDCIVRNKELISDALFPRVLGDHYLD